MTEGVRYTIEIYVTNDVANARTTLRDAEPFPAPDFPLPNMAAVFAYFGMEQPEVLRNFRLMTNAEIEAYLVDDDA